MLTCYVASDAQAARQLRLERGLLLAKALYTDFIAHATQLQTTPLMSATCKTHTLNLKFVHTHATS